MCTSSLLLLNNFDRPVSALRHVTCVLRFAVAVSRIVASAEVTSYCCCLLVSQSAWTLVVFEVVMFTVCNYRTHWSTANKIGLGQVHLAVALCSMKGRKPAALPILLAVVTFLYHPRWLDAKTKLNTKLTWHTHANHVVLDEEKWAWSRHMLCLLP